MAPKSSLAPLSPNVSAHGEHPIVLNDECFLQKSNECTEGAPYESVAVSALDQGRFAAEIVSESLQIEQSVRW